MPPDGSRPRPRLRVVIVDHEGRPLRAPALAAWLTSVAPARARGAVTVAVVSDRRVRALNCQYRGIDRATDVLSFPAAPEPHEPRPARARSHPSAPARTASHPIAPDRTRSHRPAPDRTRPHRDTFLGDIVIARGVAARQARAAGHPERTEWRVLALHGLLHLLGYDHERDDGVMQRVERRLRRRGGLDAGLIERGGAR